MDLARAPRPPTSAEADEHVRTRLLHAAVRVFDRKGYAGASVREIAEAAGVTKPTLYYHFGSKEGLLVAILTEAQREFFGLVQRAVARAAGSASDRIIALCGDVYDLFEHNVPVARVAQAIYVGPPEGAPPFDLTVFESGFLAALERLVIEGQDAGEIRRAPPAEIALAISGILQGCNERQLHPAFKPVGRDVLGRLLRLLFDGLTTVSRA